MTIAIKITSRALMIVAIVVLATGGILAGLATFISSFTTPQE
jgi:hypothetical protein